MAQIRESIGHASGLVQQGRLPEARAMLGRILQSAPDHAEALHLAGMVELMSEAPSAALPLLERCVQVAPTVPFAWSNLGVAYNACGDFTNALACFERSLGLAPGAPAVLKNQGIALRQLGRHDEAMESFRRSAQREPNDFELHREVGNLLVDMGRHEEALARYNRALAINPRDATACHNRGHAAWSAGMVDRAMADFRRAVELDPSFARGWSSLGALLDERGASAEAVGMHERAVELAPDNATFHNNLGVSLDRCGRKEQAIAAYGRSLALRPDDVATLQNRAAALNDVGRTEESLADYERAEALSPGLPYNAGHRLGLKLSLCDWNGLQALVDEVRSGLAAAKPASVPFPLCQVDLPPDTLRAAATIYAQRWAVDALPSIAPVPKSDGRIRVAYFSADFRIHPVGQLLAPLVENHDRARVETIAFSFGYDTGDETRKRLEKAFDRFEDVAGLGDADIAARARTLGIDIAIDLMGCTRGARTAIFAHRPAPIAAQYLGFPGTLGADYIEYLIADPVVVGAQDRSHYSEKIVTLPGTALVAELSRPIAEEIPTRASLGLGQASFVFCCFCNRGKITPDAFEPWMNLLREIEGSVLWLANPGSTAAANLRAEAQARGIEPGRLVFAHRTERLADHYARLGAADLFLDTFHYNGHVTTSDALFSGLPVLTRRGATFASRVSASLLQAVGLPELVTSSTLEYTETALHLARDRQALDGLRRRLAANRATSAAFDVPRLARDLERGFAAMVERHRAGLAPDHINLG